MHPLVKEYLDGKIDEQNKVLQIKINEQNKVLQKKKEKLLIELGLFEKEYSPENKSSNEYPFFEYDEKAGISRYYKKVPVEVSDSVYEEILKYQNQDDTDDTDDTIESVSNKSGISIVFKILAWITFIGGFISGFVFGMVEVTKGTYYTHTSTEFSFTLALTYWAVSFVSGMVFLGFAEVIQLLTDIKNAKQ